MVTRGDQCTGLALSAEEDGVLPFRPPDITSRGDGRYNVEGAQRSCRSFILWRGNVNGGSQRRARGKLMIIFEVDTGLLYTIR